MNRSIKITLMLAGAGIFVGLAVLYWPCLVERANKWLALVKDPEQVRTLLTGWGPVGAPVAFIGIQVLQVIFAPVPGEASGFIGGYLFGTAPGFIYSTIGLTVGSVINFSLARILGRRYVTRWIPSQYTVKLDAFTRRQGVIAFFLCFVIPGFPKDYLCIFLGLTTLSARVFVAMVTIGRMPGTLMLSLQGAQVFQKDYVTLVVLIIISMAFVMAAYHWRERIYGWQDRRESSTDLEG